MPDTEKTERIAEPLPEWLADAEKHNERAQQLVYDLCNKRARWVMCVPVQPTDSDVVLAEALADAANLLELAKAQRAALVESEGFLVAHEWHSRKRDRARRLWEGK